MISRPSFHFLGKLGAVLLPLLLGAPMAEAQRPNVLFITADDLHWDSLGAYGSPVPDITPNLDRLAAEGMRFERAHVTVAVCQPSRSVLMTGRYPHRNGARGFEPIREDVPTLLELLHEAGYLSGILGKVDHLAPIHKFRWAMVQQVEKLGTGRDPERYGQHVKRFIKRAQREGRPFFLMANAHDPHRPFAGSADEQRRFGEKLDFPEPSRTYRPEEVVVPGFLPDLPKVREEVAQYYSSVRRLDDMVGAVLRALAESGEAGNTVVMFLSDNGMSMPFAKSNTYLNSTKTPWIVLWPGHVIPGTRDHRHYISGIDFMPTILEMTGVPSPEGLDGQSFLPVLKGIAQPGRNHIFTFYHASSDGRQYPMRARQDRRFGYIYNGWADGKTRFNVETQHGLTFAAMKRAGKQDAEIAKRVELYLYRTPEELYDLREDPNALYNLAGDPRYREQLKSMRRAMRAWMRRTGDDLLPEYREYLDRSNRR